MTQSESAPSSRRMQALVEPLRDMPGVVAQLPAAEGAMIQAALDGSSVYEIAQQNGISEAAVWSLLQRVTQLALGRTQPRTEVGGLGSDTDPGVQGGYDAT